MRPRRWRRRQRTDRSWTAGGLFTQPADFAHKGTYSVGGPGDRTFVSVLKGATFVPDPAAAPACGEQISGVKVSVK
ncbi:hypothetical protein ABZX77_51545 [Streptomyces sp. NPDC004237]|uniref:hypothetical protein n=1 Tax=Streptomyces sp. NPDC004237 TaxID=3154455 RepID=UPI0033B6E3D6